MSTNFISFQDFEEATDRAGFIGKAISWHIGTKDYKVAVDAELYDRQLNPFINDFSGKILSKDGKAVKDPSSTLRPIASNFFHELNTERAMYSLGNGLIFSDPKTKEKLGPSIDQTMQTAGCLALEQGRSFIFYNLNDCYVFPLTNFVPLVDEESGALKAGIRFWQVAENKPAYAVLYESDGFEKFKASAINGPYKSIDNEKKAYKMQVAQTAAFGEIVTGYENYNTFPIVPLYGNINAQSTLVGMKQAIDTFDLIQSGFADNVANCQQIYWIIENCGGMDEEDYAKARQNLLFRKMINVDSADGTKITPYTTPIPTDAHEAVLTSLHDRIYKDFGAVNVSDISSSAKTATEINAAYLPMDLRADDFEYQIIKCITQLLGLAGVTGTDAVPSFKRNRVTNEEQQTQMILSAANYLDDETILSKLPFISPDEITNILKKKDAEEANRYKPDDDGGEA